jgi:hypothetical protein
MGQLLKRKALTNMTKLEGLAAGRMRMTEARDRHSGIPALRFPSRGMMSTSGGDPCLPLPSPLRLRPGRCLAMIAVIAGATMVVIASPPAVPGRPVVAAASVRSFLQRLLLFGLAFRSASAPRSSSHPILSIIPKRTYLPVTRCLLNAMDVVRSL